MKNSLLTVALMATLAVPAFCQGGAYIEYKTTTSKSNISSSAKSYYVDGNTRMEVVMNAPGLTNGITLTYLVLKDHPDSIYTLYEKDKTFSAAATEGNKKEKNNGNDYEITVLGKENVDGYNCVHVKAVDTKTKKVTDLWISKEVIDYAFFNQVRNKYLGNNKIYTAMAAQHVEGFPVRILVNDGRNNVQLDLVKAERQKIDPSMVSLAGYTRGAAKSPLQMIMQQQH